MGQPRAGGGEENGGGGSWKVAAAPVEVGGNGKTLKGRSGEKNRQQRPDSRKKKNKKNSMGHSFNRKSVKNGPEHQEAF